MSVIIKEMNMLKDGLYNVMNGKFFKYKAKGGTVRQYDIIEVVECKDCKWAESCKALDIYLDGFCSKGERREE